MFAGWSIWVAVTFVQRALDEHHQPFSRDDEETGTRFREARQEEQQEALG
jgi:hypothetical protein